MNFHYHSWYDNVTCDLYDMGVVPEGEGSPPGARSLWIQQDQIKERAGNWELKSGFILMAFGLSLSLPPFTPRFPKPCAGFRPPASILS